MRDPFSSEPAPIVREVRLRQLQADNSIAQYLNHGVASPELAIADQRVEFTPTVVGEDGAPMTFERRQQLMAGRPTLKQVAEEVRATGRTAAEVYDYANAQIDITVERLGQAAEKARLPWRVVKAEPMVEPVPVDRP